MTRSRKLELAKFAPVHVRPHKSEALPNTYVASLVVNREVVLAVVQLLPPSQESWTQNLGELEVDSTLPSRRTSMPLIAELVGIAKL